MLIICEKPSAASEFAKALGCKPGGGCYRNDKYVITNCIGHLYRLWEPGRYRAAWKKWSLEELPILVNEYNYEKNEQTAKQAAVVENLVKAHINGDMLIATDAGREGEVIAREALREAGLTDISRCKRFWVSEALTPEVIRRGIASAKPLSAYNAVASRGFARQRADWLAGMNLSRFITLSSQSGEKFSVGRVQTAVLSAVLSRNGKATNFIPAPYNELEITVTDKNNISIKALLANPESIKNENASAFRLKSPYVTSALEYAKAHTGGGGIAVTAETKKKSQKPEKLLNLTALQKAAFRLYGYSPGETLAAAQALHEKHKCLSYPRTPSRVMGDNNVDLFREIYNRLKSGYPQWSQFSNPALIAGSNKHIFNSAALEDHHALIPLAPLPAEASQKEKNVFETVVKSFFAVCMPDYTWNEREYLVKNGAYAYRAATREILGKGWKRIYTEDKEDGIQETKPLDSKTCRIADIRLLDKQTSPPKNFRIDTLLAFMENPQGAESAREGKPAGLGTPATRAEIIKTLFDRNYLAEDKKSLIVTGKGRWLVKSLLGSPELSKITDAAETAAWERRLEEDPAAFEKSIAEYVKRCVRPGTCRGPAYEKETPGACPLCGDKVYEGKNGYFCSSWNSKTSPCKFVVWKKTAGARVSLTDIKALLAGKKTGVKNCTTKEGKKFKAAFVLDGAGAVKFQFQNGSGKHGGSGKGRAGNHSARTISGTVQI